MEHPNAGLVRRLYEARDRSDSDAVRSVLAEEAVWHEPDLGGEHSGDLHGPNAVLAMIGEAQELAHGTFRLRPREIVANGEHAVALVDWSATRSGRVLEGKKWPSTA